MRTIDDIDAEIAAAKAALDRLRKERETALEKRRLRILELHDAGMIQREIATLIGAPMGTVATVLFSAGRRRKRPAIKTFPPELQRDYRRARAHGIGADAARQIAGCR